LKYVKPPLTIEEQVDRLIYRGMGGDRSEMARRLKSVSYYRLSGYWYPFRKTDPQDPHRRLDDFVAGTHFDAVWERYVFDRRLRLLVLDAIERIEIAVRCQFAYCHGHSYGPFAYAEKPETLPNCPQQEHAEILCSLRSDIQRSKEPFVVHFQRKYGDSHKDLPIWMAVECLSFGKVLTLYRASSSEIKRSIARIFHVHESVFDSWLLALNTVRNICAHHGRLWNRELGTKPKIPAKDESWHKPVHVKGNRIFGILTICKWCLDTIAPQSHWPGRLVQLLHDFPNIPLKEMGFAAEWKNCPIWQMTQGVDALP
jgi:abortive infection bacteriophage resistance protein